MQLGCQGIKKLLCILVLDFSSEVWNNTYEIVFILQYYVFNAILPMLKCENEKGQKKEKLFFYSLFIVRKGAQLLHYTL